MQQALLIGAGVLVLGALFVVLRGPRRTEEAPIAGTTASDLDLELPPTFEPELSGRGV